MSSEALARVGTLGGLVVLEVTMRGGKRSGGSLVSMVLTSRVQRCCAPERNRRISTIPAGRFDGRLGNVSAVDTGPLRVSPGLLPQSPGASVTGPPAPLPGRRLRWGPVVMVRRRPRPESARVGLLHEGRDLLAKGCAYCTKALPTRSAPDPHPVAPRLRAVRPDDAVSHHSDRVCPLRQAEAAVLPSRRRTPPVS